MKYIKFDKDMRKEMRMFLLLWSTQSLSGLGSAMTAYALVIWSYTQKGSALMTALLMVSSYAPYVLLSIFAGALSDKWNKKATMLVCDTMAALTTVVMLMLLKKDMLQIWHLYLLNALNGLMNTVQQPASEVATTRILPKKYYQRVGGLRYLSSSVNANLDAIMRLYTPEEMQGRIYSVRNSLQFFTIPIGYLLGGFLVDSVFEPLMTRQKEGSVLYQLFGGGKGSGAAFLFFFLAFAGIGVCLYFRQDKHIWDLEKENHTPENDVS